MLKRLAYLLYRAVRSWWTGVPYNLSKVWQQPANIRVLKIDELEPLLIRNHPEPTGTDSILVKSIRDNGIINPLTVCMQNGRYQVLNGVRRLMAARRVGLKEVPVHIVTLSK